MGYSDGSERAITALPVIKEEARCTGHCCQHFTMSQSPERLWQMYDDWYARGPDDRQLPYHNDIHIIAPMVILLEKVTEDPLDGRPYDKGITKYNYTCKHYNAAEGNCGIYEHRPQMCRDYPDGYQCRYEGCTSAAGKAPSSFIGEELAAKLEEVGSVPDAGEEEAK